MKRNRSKSGGSGERRRKDDSSERDRSKSESEEEEELPFESVSRKGYVPPSKRARKVHTPLRPKGEDEDGGGGGADQDTWSSLTGALWDQFWGTGEYAPARSSGPRPSRIMDAEPFESLYSKMPKRLPGKHE